MEKMHVVIARFLALPESDGFSIYDKFAHLIKSVDGDSYYLCEFLVGDGFITEELANEVYKAVTKDVTYRDILNWYTGWITSIS